MKKLVLSIAAAVVAVAGFVMMPNVSAVACPTGSLREGDTSVKSLAECNVEKKDNLFTTLQSIINLALAVLGFVAVAMLVIGGVGYQTSAGDAAKVKKAKDTIMYGIVGLVIAMLAYAIVNFILANVFNSEEKEEEDGGIVLEVADVNVIE